MTLAIDSDFPGGNIVVEDVRGDQVRMRQDLRDTRLHWFYWCCRVRGAAGQTLRFTMTGTRALGVRGPAVSWDQGLTWRWLGAESVAENSFACAFPEGADEARLSFAMPFVDKDGVEDGDQGKNRQPRDHNRDYAGDSLYAETAAIRKLLPEWGGARLRVGLDLHDPHISGRGNEVIFLVGSPDPVLANEQRRFSDLLEAACRGPLPFRAADFLAHGTGWNTAANEAGGRSFGRWIGGLPGVALAASIEIPYATASGIEVNQASARAFGHDLAAALAAYLRAKGGDGHG